MPLLAEDLLDEEDVGLQFSGGLLGTLERFGSFLSRPFRAVEAIGQSFGETLRFGLRPKNLRTKDDFRLSLGGLSEAGRILLSGVPFVDVENRASRSVNAATTVRDLAATFTQIGHTDITEEAVLNIGQQFLDDAKEKKLSGLLPFLFSETGEGIFTFEKDGILDISRGGAFEFGVSLIDPLFVLPKGSLIKIAKPVARFVTKPILGPLEFILKKPIAETAGVRMLKEIFTPLSKRKGGKEALKQIDLQRHALREIGDDLNLLREELDGVVKELGITGREAEDGLLREIFKELERPGTGLVPGAAKPVLNDLRGMMKRFIDEEQRAGIATRAFKGKNAPTEYYIHATKREFREWLENIGRMKGKDVNFKGARHKFGLEHASTLSRSFDTVQELEEWAEKNGFFKWAADRGMKNAQVVELDPFLAAHARALRSVKAVSASKYLQSLSEFGQEATEELLNKGFGRPTNEAFNRLVGEQVRVGSALKGLPRGPAVALSNQNIRTIRELAELSDERFINIIATTKEAGRLLEQLPDRFILNTNGRALLKRARDIAAGRIRGFPGSPILETRRFTDLVFSPAIVKAIDETLPFILDDDIANKLLGMLRASNKIWKPAVTKFFPAFIGRNALSNIYLNALGGVFNPATYIETAYVMAAMAPPGSITRKIIARGGIGFALGAIATGDIEGGAAGALAGTGTVLAGASARLVARRYARFNLNREIVPGLSYVQAVKEFGQRGIMGGFFNVEMRELFPRSVRPLFDRRGVARKALQWIDDTADGANRLVEEHARLTHAFDKLKKNVGEGLGLTQSLDRAAASTKKFMIDYTDLSPIERKYLKEIIPFYTFSRKNLPLQLEAIAKDPFKFGAVIRGMGDRGFDDDELDGLPGWMGLSFKMGQEGGKSQIVSRLGIPLEEAFELIENPLTRIASGLNPLIKAPLEAAIGRGFFFGEPLTKRALTKQLGVPFIPSSKEAIGEPLFQAAQEAGLANALEALLQNSPLSRVLSTSRRFQLGESGRGPQRAVQFLTGIRVEERDPEELRRQKVREQLRELEQQGLVRRGEVFFAPEEVREREGGEEITDFLKESRITLRRRRLRFK